LYQVVKDAFRQLQQQYTELVAWSLSVDNAKRRAGICYLLEKKIAISRSHIELNEQSVVLDTLYHEVAHALAWENHRHKGHGAVWRNIVATLGGQPKATGRYTMPKTNWVLVFKDEINEDVVKVAERYRRNKKIQHYEMRGRPETRGKLFYLSWDDYQGWLQKQCAFNDLSFVR